jgi:hypothetical protein
MPFITAISTVSILLLCSPYSANAPITISARLKGVPMTTVEELVASLRKEGFQWKFIGRQIDFRGTVLSAGPVPRVRIAGMDKDKLDTAWLHTTNTDNSVKVGQQLQIRGLIVDQHYGVWRVWKYTCSVVDQEKEISSPRSNSPSTPAQKK